MKKVYSFILALVAFVAMEATAQSVTDSFEIYFEYNTSVLNKESQAEIDSFLALTGERRIMTRIVGHACDIGTDDYNMKLSEDRAKSAFEYLQSKGEPEEKTELLFYGESQQKYDQATREKNRRVVIQYTLEDVSDGNNYDARNVQTTKDGTDIPESSDENDNEEMHEGTTEGDALEGGSVSVFNAPVNVSVSYVVSPSVSIPAAEQEELKPILIETPSEPGCDCGFDFSSATKAELKLYRRARLSERTVSTNAIETQCLNLCILKALAAEGKYQEAERGLRNLTASERRSLVKKKG